MNIILKRMMNKISIIILLTIMSSCAATKKNNTTQSNKIEIWTKQTKINKVLVFEKSLNKGNEILDQNVSLSKSVFPLFDQYNIAKPLIVKRKPTGFLPVYAEYFFSEKDSIIRYVSYNWERDRYGNYFKKQEIWKEECQKLKQYNLEYEKIKLELINKFGLPIEQDSKPITTESTSGRGNYLARNTVWETDNFHAKLNMIFESMTYRIRLNYYWKK